MSYIDNCYINALRVVGAEMITKAKSGHPGIVLGAAPIVHTLFTKHICISSNDEKWFNRDRFVLSAGHGSTLLYMMLHLSGYGVTMDDLKNLRQKGAMTPGHPEYGHTPGVEITTGPLGQGIASAVGMAIVENYLSAKFNKPDFNVIDHYTYVLCGDGDLQEGVAQEAMSLAGHLGLNKLIILYDSNDIQLDGEVQQANTENTKLKAEAMGFEYIRVEDGNDVDSVDQAISNAKLSNKPTLIEIKTIIGYGAPNSGESSIHGKPMPAEDVKELRKFLAYNEPEFTFSENVKKYYEDNVKTRGYNACSEWNHILSAYANKYPEDYYKRLANLGNNYSSQKKCEGSECLSTSEFMYYLKIADIKTRYEKKYGVSLDWYLISATNLYKTETTEETMTANLGGYDTKSVDNLNTVSGLDWENDYKNISGYVYLDRDDSTYDLQILAKNMVTKKTIQKCVTSSGTVTSKQEDTDVEDVYLNSTKKLKCSSNETYIINSTYTKDEEKFKEFMLEYIDLKMYSNGSGNKGNHQSSCSVTTDGSYLWPIGSVETTTGKDGKTYALGTPEYGKENISRGYANGHQGLDIHSSSRINVVNVIASKSGTVVYPTSLSQTGYADVGNSSDGGGYCNYVKIQHDDGSYTLYGHMAQHSITVRAGDKVGAGQVIGKMGHSGDSTGANLNFEVRS